MFYAPALSPRADRRFARFVDEFFTPGYRSLNVKQDDKAWTVTLDLPGIARDQLTIDVEGAVVRVATKEGAARQFKAAYELPEEIETATTEAKLENGVLTLVLGKKKPVTNARTIEVK